jgi:hypothetical protein
MTRESTDHDRITLEDIPDNLGLGEFDAEPHGGALHARGRPSVVDPGTDGSPTYRVLSPSEPVTITASIETRRVVPPSLGQRALDRVGNAALVAIDRGLALASRRPWIRIDQSAVVATVLAVAVVGYGALYLAVWDRPAPAGSSGAARIVRTADVAAVVAPRRAAAVETAASVEAPLVSAIRTPKLTPRSTPRPRPATTPAARAPASPARVGTAAKPVPAGPVRVAVVPQPLSGPKVEVFDAGPSPPEPRRAEADVAVVPAVVATPAAAVPNRRGVDEVLAAYRNSYNTLDVRSVVRVWDGADQRALQRAFSSLKRQRVAFNTCDVDITSADRALAHCVGVLSYVPKYGDASEQRRPMEWTIYLQQHDAGWVIASVAARDGSQGRSE